MPQPKLVLASRSPQRRGILETLGVPFELRPVDVVEQQRGEPVAVAPCSTSVVARRRRRRGTGAWPGTSASQYGQIGHCGSSGRPQLPHGSLSLRMQLGQRR